MATTFFQPFFEKLHYISLKGMNYGSANSPKDSGELAVMKILKNELPLNPILFDVGANNGQYLGLLLDVLKDKNPIIHSFEPEQKAYEKLSEKFKNSKNVILNNFALGEAESTSMLFVSKDGGVDSSLIYSGKQGFHQYEIKVNSLDEYCKKHDIEKIHFLKVDVEGFEMSVLRGSASLILNHSIERIQLEHGSIHSILAGSSLYKYIELLQNYSLYHIKQNGIYKLRYSPKNEIFYNSNYYFKIKEDVL